MTKRPFFSLLLLFFALGGMQGCDKLKALTATKKVVIKAPKVTFKITKLSKAVRMHGAHKALIIKALKKAGGFRQANIDIDKRTIVVGHTDDADTNKFIQSLQDYGYRVSSDD